MADEPEAQREPRGVQNPRVVDLITPDPDTGEVVLVMLEERRWEDEAQMRQLEAKFNAYLEYVLGGHLAQQYPDYAGRPVRFELQCVENPPGSHQPFFTAMSNFAAGEGIRWVVMVRQADAR